MKDYRRLRSNLSDVAKAESASAKNEILLEMSLHQFRKEIAGITQCSLADRLHVSQAEVSKLERRRDMLISSLRAYCIALGAELHIVMEYGGTQTRLMMPVAAGEEITEPVPRRVAAQ
ncbi:MAG: hypothetical protein QOJ84_3507 [Bradyrhizobium sp.]|jgi:predicted transcriptional regulator|nr:hypothetical protein [Bradyrhizobium sp.]